MDNHITYTKKHSYCGGCNLLTPCGLHLARCEIDENFTDLQFTKLYI